VIADVIDYIKNVTQIFSYVKCPPPLRYLDIKFYLYDIRLKYAYNISLRKAAYQWLPFKALFVTYLTFLGRMTQSNNSLSYVYISVSCLYIKLTDTV